MFKLCISGSFDRFCTTFQTNFTSEFGGTLYAGKQERKDIVYTA